MIDEVIENKIKPFMNEFIGEVYEEICMDYLKILNKTKKLPFIFENIGKWWGNNPYKKREEEIDIVAFDNNNILFGECKWRNQKVDMSVLNNLIEKSMIFNNRKKFYVLFSKSGFADEVINFAIQNPYVLLISKFEV
ncbi:hypothetical protein CaldiYA01_23430 [Caldicellulosiruptor diazotrophicus]|uniref:DUF234 domain-containing protein n=1 Tax=Caldicellulosiruptor diazotrophicus TaxID=2806205 RepID=A0ABM7NQG7_9FIRM|nr:hypothetical protein CaldiYA01_23430 [Caldicellulosiruptor diazotrophicus]